MATAGTNEKGERERERGAGGGGSNHHEDAPVLTGQTISAGTDSEESYKFLNAIGKVAFFFSKSKVLSFSF